LARKYCFSCAYWNPEGAIFCENCGAKLPVSESASLQPQAGRYCSNCGEAVLQGGNFCTNCGHQIREAISQIPKQSVSQLPSSRVTVERGKSTTITAASVLFFIFGILGTAGSLYLIAGSIAIGIIPLFGIVGIIPGFIGIAWFIIAIFNIVAGRRKKNPEPQSKNRKNMIEF